MAIHKIPLSQWHINEGIPKHPYACAIAQAILSYWSNIEELDVSPSRISFATPDGDRYSLENKPSTTMFIRRFDKSEPVSAGVLFMEIHQPFYTANDQTGYGEVTFTTKEQERAPRTFPHSKRAETAGRTLVIPLSSP